MMISCLTFYICNTRVLGAEIATEIENGINLLQQGLADKAEVIFTNSVSKLENKEVLSNEEKGFKGSLYNNIGAAKAQQGQMDVALDYYLKSKDIFEELNDQEELAATYNNIALINHNLGNYEYAISNYEISLDYYKTLGSHKERAIILKNLGMVYEQLLGEYDKALEYYDQALEALKDTKEPLVMADIFSTIGSTYHSLGEYEKANSYYEKSLELREAQGDQEGIVDLYNYRGALYYQQLDDEKAIEYYQKALNLAEQINYEKGMEVSYSYLANAYAALQNYEKAYELSSEYAKVMNYNLTKDSISSLQEMQEKFETEKREKEIALLTKENELKEARFKNMLIATLSLGIILIAILGLGMIIIKEKKKSDKLLKNILPNKVANELKATGKTTPESFENVTIFFSDFVGFTKISTTLEPAYLINELSDIFTGFDAIMEKHGCERIKTIGDAYFAVCGMPVADPDHAKKMLGASKEIVEYLKERNKTTELEWNMRVGIHSGKVVGGVVGVKKYIYDVFGDTVNTASRMESHSEAMRINVSRATYELVKEQFSFTEREPVQVKGKDLMEMFFLES